MTNQPLLNCLPKEVLPKKSFKAFSSSHCAKTAISVTISLYSEIIGAPNRILAITSEYNNPFALKGNNKFFMPVKNDTLTKW
ncbi:hypothetical protein [Myroides marinus]|uniref:hypothetical protein n=1 Tax=Myroides marinus TaxID=703342 RepID=UPI000B0C66F2|nr:hypothetical protein [Myroides marinus]